MGTLKMLRGSGVIAKTPEKALEILTSGGYKTVVMYSSDNKVLSQQIEKVYEGLKKHNEGIPNVEDQLLPTEPYLWRDIDGCLGVICVEIDVDVASNFASSLHVFTELNYDCLTNPAFRKPLSSKALTTMAILGHMLSRQK